MAMILRQISRYNIVPSQVLLLKSLTRFSSSKIDGADTGSGFTKTVLDKLVKNNKVVIFMKGNPEAPRCGFSNAVVQILRMHGVPYDAHDVLQNEELRQSIKDFSEWPTIPQVFINGEFVGGCDILLQMHQSGDLIEELKKVGVESLLLAQAKAAEDKKDTKK